MRLNKEEFEISKGKIDMSNLKKLREAKNYSQIKMQDLVGVSNSSIEGYEQGVRIPSLPVAYKIADIFDVSIDYLVGRNNELEKYYTLTEEDKRKVVNLIKDLSEN